MLGWSIDSNWSSRGGARSRRALLLASAVLLGAPAVVHAASVTVTSGQTVTTTTNIGGTDAVVVNPGGNISVAAADGVVWSAPATGAGVTIDNGGVIAGAAAAIGFSGAPTGNIAITNTGSIQSYGAGINLFGTTGNETVTTSGTIKSGYGVAIVLGTGADTLNVTTSALILGRVNVTSGTGTLNLSGAGSGTFYGSSEGVDNNPASPTYGVASTFVGWDGFSTVNVNSGTWSLIDNGKYDQINIAQGATFIIENTGPIATPNNGTPNNGGIGPLNGTLSLVNNGTLDDHTTDHVFDYDPTAPVAIAYSGSGNLEYTGPGLSFIAPNWNMAVPGGTLVANGTLFVLGDLASDVTVSPSGTLQIGGDGTITTEDYTPTVGNIAGTGYIDTGLTGNVTGNIVDNGALIFARLDDYTLSGALTGNGTVLKEGPGSLSLGTTTDFTGQVTLAAGALNNAGTLFSSGVTPTTASEIFAAPGTNAPLSVNNTGVIQSKYGVGVSFAAASATDAETVTDSGTINGGYGIAVLFSGGADTLNVTTTASIVGRVYDPAGTGTINLSGTGAGTLYGASEGLNLNAASPTYGVASGFAGWDGFSTLNVNGGVWTLDGGGYYSQLNIAAGATLISGTFGFATPNGTPSDSGIGPEADGPLASVTTSAGAATITVVNDGLLEIAGADTAMFYDPSTPSPLAYSGSGQVEFAGSGVHFINPGQTFVVSGGTSVSGSKLEVLGDLVSDVTVNPGASLQIGGGGVVIQDLGIAAGNFTDSGLIGNVTGAIVDNGTVVFARLDDYDFTGAFSGNGTLVKDGPGVLTFEGPYSFTGATTVNGGTIDIADLVGNTTLDLDSGTLNLTGNMSTIANLTGTGGTVTVATGDTLTVTTGNFGGTITGGGSLDKVGNTTLALTGNVTLTGTTTVSGGDLQVDGSLSSPVVVGDGASLGGTGSITGNVTVASGGTFSPGDPVTTNVIGAVTFKSGSSYLAQVTPSAADLINVTGPVSIQAGAAVEVMPLGNVSSYGRLNTYTIVTATGGVSGTFSSVTSDMPLLTPHLTYTADTVDLSLTRNDISFASLAATRNQAATAAAIEAGGFGTPLYMALVVQDTAGSRVGYDALSGELFASVPTVLLAQSDQTRRTLMNRMDQPADKGGVWGEAVGGWGSFAGGGGIAGTHDSLDGFTLGVDGGFDGWRLGVAGDYIQDDIDVDQRASSANDQAEGVSLYAGGAAGPFTLKLGASYGWHHVDAARSEIFSGFAGHTRASFEAGTGQVFGEVGYKVDLHGAVVEPFAGLSYDEVSTQKAAETGGVAALAVAGQTREVISSRMGLRASVDLDPHVSLHSSVAWRHAGDDVDGTARVAFEGTGQGFTVSGQPIAQDAAEITAGIAGKLGAHGRVDVSYSGQIASHWQDNAVKLLAAWDF